MDIRKWFETAPTLALRQSSDNQVKANDSGSISSVPTAPDPDTQAAAVKVMSAFKLRLEEYPSRPVATTKRTFMFVHLLDQR